MMREDFRVCYELWTGGTAGPMVSASEFVRLEGSHYNRLYQRRHALILTEAQHYPDLRGRISYYQL